jgi:hypothetical protein
VKKSLLEELNALDVADWVEVVGSSASDKHKALRARTSNASHFYSIAATCRRLAKILKRTDGG